VTERPSVLPPIPWQEYILDLKPRSLNSLLASLPPEDFELVRPHLRTIELVRQDFLVKAGDALTRVYFPHSGVISLVVCLSGGETIEAASVGRDSAFGAYAALDGRISLSDAIVQ